ncbi:hypothetical protein ACOL21_10895, partial [Aliarcobacter butzleri]
MSHFINTSSSSNIFSLLLRLNNLIENYFVINHIAISNYHLENSNLVIEDNKNIPSDAVNLKAQFQKLYNSDKYQITTFDTYGKKKDVDIFDNKRDFTLKKKGEEKMMYARPTDKTQYEGFIGGEWIAPVSGGYFDNNSP